MPTFAQVSELINSNGTNPINTYISSIKENVHKYIGIAYDEQIRYERLKEKDTKKVTHSSVLYDYKITEQMAFDICREYDLISPIYSSGAYRGGCWFCVKQCVSDLYQLWRDYPNYYNMLLDLEKESPVSFRPNKTLSYYTKKFESGYIPKRRKQYNKMNE